MSTDGDVRTALAVVVARGLRGDELSAEAAAVLDREITRARGLENRANLVTGLAQHDPDMEGQYRAAVFILTGHWPTPHEQARQY